MSAIKPRMVKVAADHFEVDGVWRIRLDPEFGEWFATSMLEAGKGKWFATSDLAIAWALDAGELRQVA